MKLSSLTRLDFQTIEREEYDLIILASGFEDRSTFLVEKLPEKLVDRCVVLGFNTGLETLSRPKNDLIFIKRNLKPVVFDSPQEYENLLRESLLNISSSTIHRPLRILVDYSVMSRAWYGYLLTWLRYSADSAATDVDFFYAYGDYQDEFKPLHIEEITAIAGFEGGCAGARKTVAFFGLGYDKYATLAVNELIEPDHIICYVAREFSNDPRSQRVLDDNKELLDISGTSPVFVPLGNIEESFRILHENFSQVSKSDEIIAIPMGPKPHVLATLMVAQFMQRVTCLHARGSRDKPIQVIASGVVSAWRVGYR